LKSALLFVLAFAFTDHVAAATIYSSDFESNNGGWTRSQNPDWEWGAVNFTSAGCDTSPAAGPSGAYSGTNAWGTILAGCYFNSNATSVLSRTFDLTGYDSAEFSWYEWRSIFLSFDRGELYANNVLLYSVPDNQAVDWTQRSVDLAAFVGAPVTLEFRLFATTVVNRAGWYIDDVALTAEPSGNEVPEPSTMLMSGALGVVVLLSRKRKNA
jgi:bacillopeptidase F